MRNGVRVEDSNYTTSQVIVDTLENSVYNNTLRVKGRVSGNYKCTIQNNNRDEEDDSQDEITVRKVVSGMLLFVEFF